MSYAFQVTADDVELVMNAHSQGVSAEEAEEIFDQHIAPQAERIEKAALYGNEMEEQTEYAHKEIAAILVEEGVLTKPKQ